jgi:hypothetical protein
MLTKDESPGKRATRRKAAATEVPVLTDSVAMAVLESASSEKSAQSNIDPDIRRRLVATEAYFLAERRGFAAGNELEDWVTAEQAVDSRLHTMRVA